MLANNALPYAPVIDGVDVLASPTDFARQGHIFPGPVLLGTARDECCSLEYDAYDHHLDKRGFEVDTIEDYGTNGINATKVVELYAGHNASGGFSEWWWCDTIPFPPPTRRI